MWNVEIGFLSMRSGLLKHSFAFSSLSQFQPTPSGSAIGTTNGEQVRNREFASLVRVELLLWSEQLSFFAFSVVRLTDRKYMLDLQKRIQEDYHDTLMKRISQRQVRDSDFNTFVNWRLSFNEKQIHSSKKFVDKHRNLWLNNYTKDSDLIATHFIPTRPKCLTRNKS